MRADKKPIAVRRREEAFTLRYDALYRWACLLTGDLVEAEDLLQDCYVAYVSSTTNVVIANLDGYLRRMLAYMLHSKRIRHARFTYESLDEAYDLQDRVNVLAQIEERERQEAMQLQLKRIYNFARRKNTPLGRTKAGKIFILRYYQNKSGNEVARLTGSTRGAVDQWVRIARLEIRKRYRFEYPR